MKKRSPQILCLFFFLVFMGTRLTSEAQTQPFEQGQVFQQEQVNAELDGDPGDPYCDPLCNCRKDGSICPIDNGLLALLAAGVIYGIKKVKDSRRVVA
jgi:hypothetical protein